MLNIPIGRYVGAAVIGLAAMAAVPASAATTCSVTDISPNAQACSGFYDGNLLNNANIAQQQAGLALLGFAWDGTSIVEGVTGLNGSTTLNFATLLTGISYFGIHYGAGVGGPGEATAFYRVDAGAGLDTITLAYNASSNASLYVYGNTPAVPEPATWAMMLLGFGAVGYSMRRRRATVHAMQMA